MTLLAASVTSAALLLTACSGGGGGGGTSAAAAADPSEFTFLSANENTATRNLLTALSTGACSAENAALPLKVTTEPQASLDQKVSLLAGQNALPSLFQAGQTTTITDLAKAGKIVDIAKALGDQGVSDAFVPAAEKSIRAQLGETYALPTELNIEGFWYNKQVFEQHGIDVPATWDDLKAASAKLQTAGVQPLSAAGKDGWPITRLIGNYIFRKVGPGAMKAVSDGDAKLTDADYVAGAQAVADLGPYFGPSVGSVDYGTAANTFMTGGAAMFYMGSWATSAFSDATQNKIGAENIGFFPVPTVTGGTGTVDQTPVNTGIAAVMSSGKFGPKSAAWLKCIAENFGAESLKMNGVLSGFKVNGDAGAVPALTQLVQERISSTTEPVLFFEGLFPQKAVAKGLSSVGSLVNGQTSPDSFMADIQSVLK